jgi:hypothetical protein
MFKPWLLLPSGLTEMDILGVTAIEKVLQYYRDIDTGNLQKAVFEYFGKSAIYQRNNQTHRGLQPSEGSIRSFYKKGRGLTGEHTVSDIFVPCANQITSFNEQLAEESMPPLQPLKANQIPVLVHGKYEGTQALNGQSKPVNVTFKDFHVISPAHNNKVPYRYSVIHAVNQPSVLARV